MDKMFVRYIESENFIIHGKKEKVKKYLEDEDYNVRSYGNGTYRITKKSNVLVDGISFREQVLQFYERCNLTEKLASDFTDDISEEKIKIIDGKILRSVIKRKK